MAVLANCSFTQGYLWSSLIHLGLSLLIVFTPRAILQSGCRLCYWAYNVTRSPLSVAKQLGSALQCLIDGDDTGMASLVSVTPPPLLSKGFAKRLGSAVQCLTVCYDTGMASLCQSSLLPSSPKVSPNDWAALCSVSVSVRIQVWRLCVSHLSSPPPLRFRQTTGQRCAMSHSRW